VEDVPLCKREDVQSPTASINSLEMVFMKNVCFFVFMNHNVNGFVKIGSNHE